MAGHETALPKDAAGSPDNKWARRSVVGTHDSLGRLPDHWAWSWTKRGTDRFGEQMIARPISTKMSALQPKIESDEDAAVAYYELEDLQNDRLPTVLQARKRKHELLKLKDMKRKRRDVGRCYLRFDRNAYVDLRTGPFLDLRRDSRTIAVERLDVLARPGLRLDLDGHDLLPIDLEDLAPVERPYREPPAVGRDLYPPAVAGKPLCVDLGSARLV